MTYVERNVRQLINVQDLRTFYRFLQICAARTGQLLNLSSLANDCGITHNTAKAWISVLEASYIVFLVSPHYKNFNKRLIKSPKLYFYDTGLVCLLAGIQHAEQLISHSIRGALFETWVAIELIKKRFNRGLLSNIYFWQDSKGHEIDFLIERGDILLPIEVKSGQTINNDYFAGINYWNLLNKQVHNGYLMYAGNQSQKRSATQIVPWNEIDKIDLH